MFKMCLRNNPTDVELALNKEERYKRLFERYDLNNDGKIDLQEFKIMLKNCAPEELPDYFIKQVFQRCDTDNNRYLTYDEFVEMMDNPAFKTIFQNLLNRYITTLIPKAKLAQTRRGRRTSVRGTYEDEYKLMPPPVWMILISIIQIILYSYDSSIPIEEYERKPVAKALIFNTKYREEVWRWLTYIFVHADTLHLILNVLVQLVLGIPLEMVHHGWRVMIIYLCGVLAGSLASSIASPHMELVGASGGVYAVTTAHIASLIMNWKEIQFGMVQLVIFSAMIFTDAARSIYNHASGVADNVSYVSHLAGGIAGLLVGIFILRNLDVSQMEKRLSKISFVTFSTLILAAIIFNIAYPSYFNPSTTKKYFY